MIKFAEDVATHPSIKAVKGVSTTL